MQWISGECYIFNDFCSNHGGYVSRVFSAKTGKQKRQFNLPVQDAYLTSYFLSLNYSRLSLVRPEYGYRNRDFSASEESLSLENDGIFMVDFKTGVSNLIISLQDLIAFRPNGHFKELHIGLITS